MNDDKVYKTTPQSEIKKAGFRNFMSSLFGWTANPKNSKKPINFVTVDSGNPAERLTQANAQIAMVNSKLSNKLEELFDSWLRDTGDSQKEIADRAKRVDQLTYAALNDPFIGRVIQLHADEATQLDVQDHILTVETPDPRMTKRMYELLSQWGITQQRSRSAIAQLAQYGDAFWANKVTENGVERVIPLKQLQISDRLEFSPVDALEKIKRREGGLLTLTDRYTLLKTMIEDTESGSEIADLFDTKLFGFALENDIVVPPWGITHFRAGGDNSEFYPFGTSPILGTLAPFKLSSSTITLQSIARVLNFPVTLYKVKTSNGADESRQFTTVDRVREQYDNIGVQAAGNSEVYSVNTKIWIPDGLLDVDVKAPGVDVGFTDDLEMYQDRVAVATGVPKGYLVQEWGGFGNSAISLVEQWKPFARSNYSLQTAYQEGLADLFRLHFAITGEFDFRTPFTISMRFPAEEMSDEKQTARQSSIELAGAVLDMIRTAIGAQEEDGLPPDIVRDVISKYTFLDPVDIVKWTRDAKFSIGSIEGAGGGGSSGGGGSDFGEEPTDLDLEADMSDSEKSAEADLSGENADYMERKLTPSDIHRKVLREARMKELASRYQETKDSIYFKVLQENVIREFLREKQHVLVSTSVSRGLSPVLEKLASSRKQSASRLKESITAKTPLRLRESSEESN